MVTHHPQANHAGSLDIAFAGRIGGCTRAEWHLTLHPGVNILPNGCEAEWMMRVAWFCVSLRWLMHHHQEDWSHDVRAATPQLSMIRRTLSRWFADLWGTNFRRHPNQLLKMGHQADIKIAYTPPRRSIDASRCDLGIRLDAGKILWSGGALSALRDEMTALRHAPYYQRHGQRYRQALYLPLTRAVVSDIINAAPAAVHKLPAVARDWVMWMDEEMEKGTGGTWEQKWVQWLRGRFHRSMIAGSRVWRWQPCIDRECSAFGDSAPSAPLQAATYEQKSLWPLVQAFHILQDIPASQRPSWLFIESPYLGTGKERCQRLTELLAMFYNRLGVHVVVSVQDAMAVASMLKAQLAPPPVTVWHPTDAD